MKREVEKYNKIIEKADKVILITANKKGTKVMVDNVSIQDALDMLLDTQDFIFTSIQDSNHE